MEPAFTGSIQLGGCRVELHLASTEAAWDTPITGALRLTSDSKQYQFDRLEVSLAFPGSHEPSYMDQVRIAPLTLTADSEHVAPFSLRMASSVSFSEKPQFALNARIAHLGRSQIWTSIRVLPPPEFALLAGLVASACNASEGSWSPIPDGAAVTFDFSDGSAPFQRIGLQLYRGSGTIYGQLSIEPHSHTLRDRVRAAAGLRARLVPLRLATGDQDAARTFVAETLGPYVNAVSELPIPAAGYALQSKELPRPGLRPDGRSEH